MRGYQPSDENLQMALEEQWRVQLKAVTETDGHIQVITAAGNVIRHNQDTVTIRTETAELTLHKEELLGLLRLDQPSGLE